VAPLICSKIKPTERVSSHRTEAIRWISERGRFSGETRVGSTHCSTRSRRRRPRRRRAGALRRGGADGGTGGCSPSLKSKALRCRDSRLTLTGRWTPFSPVVQLIEEVGQVISERETLLAVYVGLLGPCIVITSTGLGLFSAERIPI
jgi:hypothetical protein